jgi:staphylococcal nuclease domain-containing protein 1
MTYRTFFRNIAEQLIEKGLASAVRHKRDDEDRSPDYDKLIAAEQAYVNIEFSSVLVLIINRAAADARGIHSGKETAAPKQPLNISEVFDFPWITNIVKIEIVI